MARGARQFVLGEHGLFLPGILSGRRVRARHVAVAVPALDRLATIAPCGDAARIDDLPLDVKAADQKVIAGVLQVLKYRAGILTHEDRVRRVIVNAELVPDPVPLADAVQGNPGARCVGNVVVPAVADIPAGHGTLLDAKGEAARLRFLEDRKSTRLNSSHLGISYA